MGWLRKKSLSAHPARLENLVSSAAPEEAEEDVFAETQHLRKRASSYSGPESSLSDDLVQQTAARRHNSLCVPRRRGTKVAFDTDASPTPTSQLLHGGNRDSLLSVSAARSSPPETLGSEVPSVASGEGTYSQHPAATVQRGWGDPSRPTSATSQSTRLSQFSVVQIDGTSSPKRRRSKNFFKGDIKSSRHQLHKASIAEAKKRASATVVNRRSRDSFGSTVSGTSEVVPNLSLASLPGGLRLNYAPGGSSGMAAGGLLTSRSSVATGSSGGSHSFSIIQRLRAGIRPSSFMRAFARESSLDLLSAQRPSDARGSLASSTDLQSVLNMTGQVLDAATVGVRDEGVRGAITSTLADDNLNKRVAWMNRVLGSLYVDDGMVEEEEDDAHKNDVMFHPNSPFRARWDILIIIVIVYQVAVMPVRVAWGDQKIGLLFVVEMILSMLLMTDLVLSFHTGWEHDGDIIMEKHRVRKHYLKSWFVPELLSSIPYDIIALVAHREDPRSYKAISFRAIRFLGLLRWPRLWRYIQKWQELLSVDSIILTLTKYILGLIMFIHTAGCLVALQAFLQRNNPNSYFNRTDFTSPPGDPPSLMQRGPFVQYTYSLLRSCSGLLATGWGMSNPVSIEEIWMVLVVQTVGSFMQLVFQAAILTLVRTYDRSTANYMQRMELVKDFFARHDIPNDIRKRVVTQMLARHTNRRMMRDELLLRDMTPSMRADLQQAIAIRVLKQQPIFSTWRPAVVRAIAAELVQAVFAPGDTIFFKGEMADCMYFVSDGVVRILDPDSGKLLTTIAKGSYFGEFALLQGERGIRTASAEAATTTTLFSLSRKSFYRTAAHYPEIADSLNIVAAARAAMNSNQVVNAEDLLRIKNSRASLLMNTCRAAVAQAIVEEDEEEGETQNKDDGFDEGPADK